MSEPGDASGAKPAEAPPEVKQPLKRLAVNAAGWTFGGVGAAGALRLGGNLVLTRLLFPEAFGVMLIVRAFMAGVKMFSDVGLVQNIIQSKNGDDITFLRTAWTIQVLRGFFICLACTLISFPVALIYDDPELGLPSLNLLLPVMGIGAILDGFASTRIHQFNRHLNMKQLTLIQVAGQIFGLAALIGIAFVWESVWSLVLGGLIGSLIQTALSHILTRNPGMAFSWNREYMGEIFRFGRWIFFATIAGFIVNQSDKLVLGMYMTKTELGNYAVAVTLAGMVFRVTQQLSVKVFLPVYSKTIRDDLALLRTRARKVRLIMMCLTLPICWVMTLFGPLIVDLLYDERYLEAGPMLKLLGVGMLLNTMLLSTNSVLVAQGDTFRNLLNLGGKSVIMLTTMIIGGNYWGSWGVIYGFALAPIIHYPILALLIKKYNVWFPGLDFAGVAISSAVIAVGLYFIA